MHDTAPNLGTAYRDSSATKAYPLAFSQSAPQTAHSIEDTCAYIADAGDKLESSYIEAFVSQSDVLQRLDASGQSTWLGTYRESFPSIVIELAKFIPADEKGKLVTRQSFIAGRLAASHTLGEQLKAYRGAQDDGVVNTLKAAADALGNSPWAVRGLVDEISEAQPEQSDTLASIYHDHLMARRARQPAEQTVAANPA